MSGNFLSDLWANLPPSKMAEPVKPLEVSARQRREEQRQSNARDAPQRGGECDGRPAATPRHSGLDRGRRESAVRTQCARACRARSAARWMAHPSRCHRACLVCFQEKWKLLPAFLQLRGLVKQHIDSYNYFLTVELKQILMANQKVSTHAETTESAQRHRNRQNAHALPVLCCLSFQVHCDSDPHFFLKYTDIRVGAPSVEEELIISKTTPNECRLRDMTYAAPILVDVEYVRGKHLVKRQNVVIGRMPIMLRSCKCVLTDKSRGELGELKEVRKIKAQR